MRFHPAFLITTGLLAAGCTTNPHNDVLIFGTETQVGLQIQSEASNGGTPSINLGYNRTEAVWLPLAENSPRARLTAACERALRVAINASPEATNSAVTQYNTCITAADLAQSTTTEAPDTVPYTPSERALYQSSNGQARDTYSVFASFGARFNGSGSASQTGTDTQGSVSAAGGLAQYFATGIAAQNLADNEYISDALNAGSNQQRRAELEDQVEDLTSQNTRLQSAFLAENLTPEQLDAINANATSARAERLVQIDAIMTCTPSPYVSADVKRGLDAVAAAVNAPTGPFSGTTYTRSVPSSETRLRTQLDLDEPFRTTLYENRDTYCGAI